MNTEIPKSPPGDKPVALVILHPGFEEIEAIVPVDLLRRAGIATTVAALGTDTRVKGRNDMVLVADCTLDSVRKSIFDLIVLPGGPGTAGLRQDARVRELVRQQDRCRRLIGAICAAPLVLRDAGILPGRPFTGHATIKAELPQLDEKSEVVIDGNLVTSRGAGTAVPFGLALVELLVGSSIRSQVASSIHWNS